MNSNIFSNPATILIFVYNRKEHTRKTIDALVNNIGAQWSNVIIYSDGPKSPNDTKLILDLRKYLSTITGFKSIQVFARQENLGLSKSIISGLDEFFEAASKAIVIEDDMVTSPYFLIYMNEALKKYEDDSRVACVHGYVYPGLKDKPETFFLKGADCWGWGTWRESWKLFNSDGKFLLNELRNKNLVKEFNFNNSYPYSKMLQDQVLGKNDSWAIRWYASVFLEDKLTLYPSRSLVQNIGMDSSGQNCTNSLHYDVDLVTEPLFVRDIEVKHSKNRYKEFEEFFHAQNKNLFQRIIGGIRGWL
jgi:hypothetical protein